MTRTCVTLKFLSPCFLLPQALASISPKTEPLKKHKICQGEHQGNCFSGEKSARSHLCGRVLVGGRKERQEDPSTAAQPDRKENNKLFWAAQQFWCLSTAPLGQLHDLSSSLHPVHVLTPLFCLGSHCNCFPVFTL